MHEASLVDALFDHADRAIAPHDPARVTRITLRVGALSGAEPSLLRAAFDALRHERGYRSAALEMLDELARWRCSRCMTERAGGEAALTCERCGAPLTLAGGDALTLERLELEVPDV